MSQRATVAALIALAIIAAALVIVFATPPAHGATCASRPGVSSGSVWWRWYYRDDGGRCWYPGRRHYRHVHRARYAALRFRPKIKPPQIRREKLTLPVAEPITRTVRIIPIINGATPHQRVERAFDKLITFPIEDEP